MEMLDRASNASDEREQQTWEDAASTQIKKIGAHNLELHASLTDYMVAVLKVRGARLKQRSAQLELRAAERVQSRAKGDAAISALRDADNEEARARVTLKLCRDDADQWFTGDAPATNTCRAILDKIRAAQK